MCKYLEKQKDYFREQIFKLKLKIMQTYMVDPDEHNAINHSVYGIKGLLVDRCLDYSGNNLFFLKESETYFNLHHLLYMKNSMLEINKVYFLCVGEYIARDLCNIDDIEIILYNEKIKFIIDEKINKDECFLLSFNKNYDLENIKISKFKRMWDKNNG